MSKAHIPAPMSWVKKLFNKLNTEITNNEVAISELNRNKQNTLKFDTTPTSDSTNPVTSSGIFTALAQKYEYKYITSGNLDTVGKCIGWVNGYNAITNNPFNGHCFLFSDGYNQLIVNVHTGGIKIRHSDTSKQGTFSDWIDCFASTAIVNGDSRYLCKCGKMITLNYPSSVVYLPSTSGSLASLPSGYAPSHQVVVRSDTFANGSSTGNIKVTINTDGTVTYETTATGNQEICFAVSFLTN